MSVEQWVFYVLAAIAVGGAAVTVFARDIVRAALGLIVALLMTAGVFVLLSAEVIGLVQLLVYGGAVAILILFALMITRAREVTYRLDGPQKPLALLAGATLAAAIGVAVVGTVFPTNTDHINPVGFVEMSTALFQTYAVPFEVASLVLLVALVGAIIIARQEERQ